MSDPLTVIGNGRDVTDLEVPEGLGDKELLEIYRSIVLLRTFDERAVALQRQGRIGTYALYWGEEATQAGPVHACDDSDWLWPSYRQNSIGILRGIPASTVLAWWRGYGGEHGFWNPRVHRVAPICVPIATHLPHAVGLAWAAKMRSEPIASLVWFGDGATSEGDFHEAMNFASVFKSPIVFFCVNNQWAISTFQGIARGGSGTFAARGHGFGIPALRVDGNDYLAVHAVAKWAVERARANLGPTLIEHVTYRVGAHSTSDDPSAYRPKTESDAWPLGDPVIRLKNHLIAVGAWSEERHKQMEAEILDEVIAAQKEAESHGTLHSGGKPSIRDMFEGVFAAMPPHLRRQRQKAGV